MAIRFSVPSSWLCRARKFSFDFRSGYFSWIIISRPSTPDSRSWAWAYCWNLAGSVIVEASTLTWVAEARAWVTSTSTLRSWAA